MIRFLVVAVFWIGIADAPGAPQTKNVFLITIDGLRWQEVFSGAEELLLNKQHGGVANTNRVRSLFWRATAEERRQALLPFFWSAIAKEGQLFGNQTKASVMRVTNQRNFTYPGFNEIFTGFADDRINRNEKRPNPNVSVLEWLHRKPDFANRVVAFANWDVHPYILNAQRSGIPVWTGFEKTAGLSPDSRMALIEDLFADMTPLWPDMHFDVLYAYAALEQIRAKRPRVVWIAFSEPDEWAHEGRYDLYLLAASKIDSYIAKLWGAVQLIPEYHRSTTFLITPDHGRGTGPNEWKNHGAAVAGADGIWLAVIGPDTPPLGERVQTAMIGQNQIAATLAALLGEDYHSAEPRSGAPIPEVLTPKQRPGL